MTVVNLLVEGQLDEVVARRILDYTGHISGVCYGKNGYGYIKEKIQGFNNASKVVCCFALVDFMDTKLDCPLDVISQWLPHRNPNMIFRVVVRELESWLLADHVNLANYLRINSDSIPSDPEIVFDPKRELINLARRSQSSSIRSSLVPEPNSTAQVGKLYQSEMTKFIQTKWDIASARQRSKSLERCIVRLTEL